MTISDEFLPEIRLYAVAHYSEALVQFHQLRDRHLFDGSHPDVTRAKEVLDRARRLRCEVDPEFAAAQSAQAVA